ncbi:MAG: hypothetical protein MUE60_08430, partial [Candidatus Eisenbacteria bacterium]|nr:hypothetical protein [Candidatus Eisenbacteria bacterium]
DRLEAVVPGGKILLRFLDARTTEIRTPREVVLAADSGVLDFVAAGPGRYRQSLVEGPVYAAVQLGTLPRTLRWNWRQPLGDIHHGGVARSPSHRGFFPLDAWHHAAALPTNLAGEQIATVFDHQEPDGMVPEMIMMDAGRNNRRCSTPPLAAWACSRHPGMLEQFRPQLVRFHRWWERHRRPPGERLFAYGGSDLMAAKAESGWGDASRFDNMALVGGLQNILSVDLNAYLCMERRLLGVPDPAFERLVNELLFHEGAFYDVTWPDHRPVRTLTAATWIPLWCDIATPDHAEAVLRLMRDPEHFNTPVPFPTVARSDPKFDPDGIWRGSVWMDHAACAVEVLARHGYAREARDAGERLLRLDPDWECYNPLTGAPASGKRPAVRQFGRTAAARVAIERVVESCGSGS